MTKVVVNLASAYTRYKMLTPNGKVEFIDGVAKVEFDDAKKAEEFVKQIKSNVALAPYVRVVGEEAAKVVAGLNAASLGGIKAGPQTSEMPKIAVANNPVSPAQVLAKAEEADKSGEAAKAGEATKGA